MKYIIYYDSVLHRQLFKCTKKGTQINVQLHQKLKKITKKLTAQKMITNKCPITTNAQIKIKKELIGQKIQQKALKRKKKSLKLMKKNNSESECTKSKNHVKCKIIVKRLNCLARKLIYLESPF